MACTEFHYYSRVLDIDVTVSVILPEVKTMLEQDGKPLPTLYLLHGLSDDHTHWIRQTRLEFYARRYRLAIVMPCVNRSFYTDMKHGAKYFTFVSEELPKVMGCSARKSTRRWPACPARWKWKPTSSGTAFRRTTLSCGS